MAAEARSPRLLRCTSRRAAQALCDRKRGCPRLSSSVWPTAATSTSRPLHGNRDAPSWRPVGEPTRELSSTAGFPIVIRIGGYKNPNNENNYQEPRIHRGIPETRKQLGS